MFSRRKYFRETLKKSPRSSAGSFSVEKCHAADAKTKPFPSFSTTTVDVVFGSTFSPGTTIRLFFPVYFSGSNVNATFCTPIVTVASSGTPSAPSFFR